MSPLPVVAVPGAARYFIVAVSRSVPYRQTLDQIIRWRPVVLSGISWRGGLRRLAAMGMCLMNGYEIVKVKPIRRTKRGTGERLSIALHLFPHSKAKCVVSVKKFFEIF